MSRPWHPVKKQSRLETVTLSDAKHEYKFVCRNRQERNRASRLLDKEKGTIAWIDVHLRPDDVFYDIGANIGTYTIFAGLRLGERGRIVAFEPHIPNANSLIENIFLNRLERKVQLVTSALTNREGYDRFNYHSMAAAAAISQYGRNYYEGEPFEPQFVEVKHGCTIDVLWRLNLLEPPNLVKIDVDGLEFEVLEGMRELMSSSVRPRGIQTELGTDSRSRILRLFEERGYVLGERHWSEAGLNWIAEGHAPEKIPCNAVFFDPRQR